MSAERTHVQLDGVAKATLARTRKRIAVVATMFGLVFAVLFGRFVQLSVFPRVEEKIAFRPESLAAISRTDLTDRNGKVLATDLDAASLFVDARKVWNAEEATDALLSVLPMLDRAQTYKKMTSGQAFVWLHRDLTPRQQDAVHRLGFPFLGFRREPHRVYPHGRLASHILGYVDTDNHGLAGIERGLERTIADPRRLDEPVVLSIDVRVQHALQDELMRAMETFQAIGAAGVVMNANTGEIAAMASLPDFDPNDPMGSPPEARFNKTTLGVYEMGSTFKTFTTAMVLDAGKATLSTKYDARRPLTYGRFKISDFHAQNRILTTEEVFEHSSNIGSARMALSVGISGHRAFLGKLGLLQPMPFEVSETGRPMVPARWGELQSVTISYGHGIAVNPVQVVAATSAMVNGGTLFHPTLVKLKPGETPKGARAISPETSEKMRRLLRLVVEKGTGGKADVPGYPVGGKTGTAEKPAAGGYAETSLLTSFVAAFPAAKPDYVVVVILDEPKPTKDTFGFATAGWTAAPTAGKVIARIAPLLNVPVSPVAQRLRTAAAAPPPGTDR
jgi:cell division protein FtsI (penicillin-binding protein 3)